MEAGLRDCLLVLDLTRQLLLFGLRVLEAALDLTLFIKKLLNLVEQKVPLLGQNRNLFLSLHLLLGDLGVVEAQLVFLLLVALHL